MHESYGDEDQLLPRAHDYTVTREAESPLDQDVAMRFGVSNSSTHEQSAQRCINANAKICKCACTTINLAMYNLNLTCVNVAVSVDRERAEVECFAYEDWTDAILHI
eukprot:159292-Pleurochrysis_carterae.AAC.1